MTMRAVVVALTVALSGALASPVIAKPCKPKGGKPRVRVRPKTPMRRGPGLNYGVTRFLEKSKCLPFSEVSLDERWLLIEDGKVLGWVPVKRVAKYDRAKVAKLGTSGPVGSGQSRAAGRMLRQGTLVERPDPNAPVRRVLPENLRVLPLAVTRDGRWVQVRDDRGDVGWVVRADVVGQSLDRLPRVDGDGSGDRVVRRRTQKRRAQRRSVARTESRRASPSPGGDAAPSGSFVKAAPRGQDDGLGFRVALFGAALNPIHSLDSNGEDGLRRYDLSAASAGTGLELEVRNLGPVGVRVAYTLAFLNGVTSDVPGTGAAGGLQHDALLRVGMPFEAFGLTLTPEVGYHFGQFDFDRILAGQDQVVFLSTETHAGTVGVRVQGVLSEGWTFDADVAGLFGATYESPQTLGEAGLTVGAVVQAGTRVMVTESLSVVARYVVNYRSTSYTGEAQLDPTITEATLVDLTHGLLVGVAFDL